MYTSTIEYWLVLLVLSVSRDFCEVLIEELVYK